MNDPRTEDSAFTPSKDLNLIGGMWRFEGISKISKKKNAFNRRIANQRKGL